MFAFASDVPSVRVVPNVTERLDCLARVVSGLLIESDHIYPNETPMSYVWELVDMSVFNLFPELAACDRLALNARYDRLLTRLVGKRAFALIEQEVR